MFFIIANQAGVTPALRRRRERAERQRSFIREQETGALYGLREGKGHIFPRVFRVIYSQLLSHFFDIFAENKNSTNQNIEIQRNGSNGSVKQIISPSSRSGSGILTSQLSNESPSHVNNETENSEIINSNGNSNNPNSILKKPWVRQQTLSSILLLPE